jgi:hypothetical protein
MAVYSSQSVGIRQKIQTQSSQGFVCQKSRRAVTGYTDNDPLERREDQIQNLHRGCRVVGRAEEQISAASMLRGGVGFSRRQSKGPYPRSRKEYGGVPHRRGRSFRCRKTSPLPADAGHQPVSQFSWLPAEGFLRTGILDRGVLRDGIQLSIRRRPAILAPCRSCTQQPANGARSQDRACG